MQISGKRLNQVIILSNSFTHRFTLKFTTKRKDVGLFKKQRKKRRFDLKIREESFLVQKEIKNNVRRVIDNIFTTSWYNFIKFGYFNQPFLFQQV